MQQSRKASDISNYPPPDFKELAQTPNPADRQVVTKTDGTTDCAVPAINCLPDVTVRPHKLAELRAAIAGGPITVSQFFSGPAAIPFYPVLTPSALLNLQSGNYNLVECVTAPEAGPLKNFFKVFAVQQGPANFEYAISTHLDLNP